MNMEAVYKHVRHFNEYNHYYTLYEQQKHSISFNISATVACNSDELTMKKKIHQSISDISNSPGNVMVLHGNSKQTEAKTEATTNSSQFVLDRIQIENTNWVKKCSYQMMKAFHLFNLSKKTY